jgi:hypothetical protein
MKKLDEKTGCLTYPPPLLQVGGERERESIGR